MGLFWAIGSALVKTIFDKDPVEPRQSSGPEPLPYVPSIAEQRRAEPGGMNLAQKEAMWRQWQQTGNATLCCNRPICECGQNLRLINGVPTRLPGVVLPGSDAERVWQGLEDARRRIDSGECKTYSLVRRESMDDFVARKRREFDTQNANETTLPLPPIRD